MVDRVQTLWMDVARYQPLRGGSYLSLPAAVRNKKAVINPKNMDDNDCLGWTFLIAEADPQPSHHPERISWHAAKKGKYSCPEINIPTPVSQIPKFEKLFNKAINVFGWDGGVKIHHISNQPPIIRRHNVLLIERDGKFHFILIKTNTAGASTSASDACTATQGRICWNSINLTVGELGKPRSEWICQKRDKIKSPFRTTTSSCRLPTSSMQTLGLSPPRLRGLSSTPQRSTLRLHNTMRLVVIAISWCGVTVRQRHQSNSAAQMQQSTS